jgi:hypothetical protein
MSRNGFHSKDQTGEIWILYVQCNSWCHEGSAGATKSRDLRVEAVIKPLKICLKELAVLQDNLLKWSKLHFVLNLKFEQNITLIFSFDLRNSFA